jgi:hypothetical protein
MSRMRDMHRSCAWRSRVRDEVSVSHTRPAACATEKSPVQSGLKFSMSVKGYSHAQSVTLALAVRLFGSRQTGARVWVREAGLHARYFSVIVR